MFRRSSISFSSALARRQSPGKSYSQTCWALVWRNPTAAVKGGAVRSREQEPSGLWWGSRCQQACLGHSFLWARPLPPALPGSEWCSMLQTPRPKLGHLFLPVFSPSLSLSPQGRKVLSFLLPNSPCLPSRFPSWLPSFTSPALDCAGSLPVLPISPALACPYIAR